MTPELESQTSNVVMVAAGLLAAGRYNVNNQGEISRLVNHAINVFVEIEEAIERQEYGEEKTKAKA